MTIRFRMSFPLAALAAVALGVVPAGAAAQGRAEPADYVRDIRPLLADACFTCHGPNERARQGDLRLDTDAFLATHVVPGDAEASPLFQRLITDDRIGRMPPVSSGRSLGDETIEAVRRWIDGGAHWGTELAATVGVTPAAPHDVPARTVDFAREVRPILAGKCFSCHGPDEASRQRGLRLDVEEGPLADRARFGGTGRRARRRRREPPVPPRHGRRRRRADAAGRRGADGRRDRDHPALDRPGGGVAVALGVRAAGARRPAARRRPRLGAQPASTASSSRVLEGEGLAPSPEADRATLLRRATLDLTGLPPTPGELAAFLNDDSPDAYEKAVDRLLASPRYGERMAVEWLDAARYADTNGYQTDGERTMWRWRDWVIDAYKRQHALRPVHHRAARRRHAAGGDARAAHRHRVQPQPQPERRGRDRRRRVPRGVRGGPRRDDLDGLARG